MQPTRALPATQLTLFVPIVRRMRRAPASAFVPQRRARGTAADKKAFFSRSLWQFQDNEALKHENIPNNRAPV